MNCAYWVSHKWRAEPVTAVTRSPSARIPRFTGSMRWCAARNLLHPHISRVRQQVTGSCLTWNRGFAWHSASCIICRMGLLELSPCVLSRKSPPLEGMKL